MISKFAEKQNWAKITPYMGIVSLGLLLIFFQPSEAIFWALINIPLYLFHQTEEHYWPGGFKQYMNQIVYKLPEGEETLTDIKIFWINIILVWFAFFVFGFLTLVNLGFGLLIVIFSILNCLTHIVEGIRRKRWNPGLVMSSLQFTFSIYAAYFITEHGLSLKLFWWIGAIVFSVLVHAVLFKVVIGRKSSSSEI